LLRPRDARNARLPVRVAQRWHSSSAVLLPPQDALPVAGNTFLPAVRERPRAARRVVNQERLGAGSGRAPVKGAAARCYARSTRGVCACRAMR